MGIYDYDWPRVWYYNWGGGGAEQCCNRQRRRGGNSCGNDAWDYGNVDRAYGGGKAGGPYGADDGGLRPVLHLLFPRIPEGHKAREYIAANIIANVLGLGWAATPMGLKAMKELAVIERERLAKQRGIKPDDIEIKKASDEMCTFLVINISSLQLIPVSVIAYRAQYGAVNPAAIVLPGLIATLVSTVVAVMFCRVMCRKGEK